MKLAIPNLSSLTKFFQPKPKPVYEKPVEKVRTVVSEEFLKRHPIWDESHYKNVEVFKKIETI